MNKKCQVKYSKLLICNIIPKYHAYFLSPFGTYWLPSHSHFPWNFLCFDFAFSLFYFILIFFFWLGIFFLFLLRHTNSKTWGLHLNEYLKRHFQVFWSTVIVAKAQYLNFQRRKKILDCAWIFVHDLKIKNGNIAWTILVHTFNFYLWVKKYWRCEH